MSLPTDKTARKERPIARGVLDYFPDALAEVAHLSLVGNQQHNPGQELHWDKSKSTDHADCIVRHLIDRGTTDTDGIRHAAKVAWRALALLQVEIEKDREKAAKQISEPAVRYQNGFLTYKVENNQVLFQHSSCPEEWIESVVFRSPKSLLENLFTQVLK